MSEPKRERRARRGQTLKKRSSRNLFDQQEGVNAAKPNADTAILRGCPNQKASQMTECVPWTFTPIIPTEAQRDKAAFRTWGAEATTNHLFYTASEGICPTVRVNKVTNPLRRLHGVIADYDASLTSSVITEQLKKWAGENQPNWVSRTFSDGVRAVWLFEQPLPLDNMKLVKPFLKLLAEELRLKKLFAGWDERAWNELSQIYEVGRDWRQIASSPLPKNRLYEIFVRAAGKVCWAPEGTKIPMEVIADEVERKYPGRWDGPFEEGRRGVAFFDPHATNPTAAIVTESGMVCFSQEKNFYTWRDIFGPEFVQKYDEDRIGAAASEAWYDGKSYWVKSSEGIWQPHSRDDFALRLRVRHRLNSWKFPGETCSEVDRVLDFVHAQRRVDGAVPRIYSKEDILTINGRRFVNCSAAQVVQPAEVPQTWGEDFPWLAEFLDTCFDPTEQKSFFLAWWKRFYCSALAGDPLKGHGMFIVGPVNAGKTLLGTKIVGASVGGHSDASDHITKGSEFNKNLIHSGLWCIDDGLVASDATSHRKFSEMVKRLVANPVMNYRAMFHDAQSATWNGRIFVTLNDDVHSIQMLPDLETSMEEKVMILRFSEAARVFPPKHILETTIAAELPYLLRWLVDWEVPAEIKGDHRLGVKTYIHEELRAKSLYSGGVGDLLELVDLWIKRSSQLENEEYWEGTATEWLSSAGTDDGLRPLTQKYTPRSAGRKFADASKLRDSGIEIVPSKYKGNGNRYRIKLRHFGRKSLRKPVVPDRSLIVNQTQKTEPHAPHDSRSSVRGQGLAKTNATQTGAGNAGKRMDRPR